MNIGKQRLLACALAVLSLTVLLVGGGHRSAARAGDGDRRRIHVRSAAEEGRADLRLVPQDSRRLGPPSATAWTRRPSATAWTPGNWCAASTTWVLGARRPSSPARKQTCSPPGSISAHAAHRAACRRWEKIGLINDPDCVAADKPDRYGLKIDRMKDGALTWDPEVFGFSSGVVGPAAFQEQELRREEMVHRQVPR